MTSLEETAIKKIVTVLKANDICFLSSTGEFQEMISEMRTPTEQMDIHLTRIAIEILEELNTLGIKL